MREQRLNTLGRIFLAVNFLRIFVYLDDRLINAVLNVTLVLGAVFVYEDWWKLVLWVVEVKKKLDSITESRQFQRGLRWFFVILLPLLAGFALFNSFYLPFDTETGANVFGFCGGVIIIVLWIPVLKHWKP